MTIDTQAALQYFKQTDPVMHQLLQHSLTAPAPIALPVAKDPEQFFHSIVTSIISQQISTKAAAAIRGRVEAMLGEVTPERVRAVETDELKACGLSNQKVRYITENAVRWRDLPYRDLPDMTDEGVTAELTKLYGIGVWTAEMFLMFSLARPNVFSYGDLGLMNSLYHNYGYQKHWNRKIANTVDAWSPHKTLASLALWHTVDNGPVLL